MFVSCSGRIALISNGLKSYEQNGMMYITSKAKYDEMVSVLSQPTLKIIGTDLDGVSLDVVRVAGPCAIDNDDQDYVFYCMTCENGTSLFGKHHKTSSEMMTGSLINFIGDLLYKK